LNRAAGVCEIAMQNLNKSKASFDNRRIFIDWINEILFAKLGQNGHNEDFVFLGRAVGIGFQRLEDGDVLAQILRLTILVNYFIDFADALN
jgi:hypothetical protein